MSDIENREHTSTHHHSNTVKAKTTVTQEEVDDFSYVLPKESWKAHRKASKKNTKARKKNKVQSTRITDEERAKAEEGFVFVEPRKVKKHKVSHKHKHKNKKKRALAIVLGIIAALLIIMISTVVILRQSGSAQLHTLDDSSKSDDEKINLLLPDKIGDFSVDTEESGKIITYKDHKYELNKEVIPITFMGCDSRESISEKGESADSIFILALDTSNSKITIIPVSRETMTDVDVYTDQGNFVGTQKLQICLAYDYGTDANSRCENVHTSLSRLFYNLPFSTYFAIDMSAISILNDEIGGVNVISSITFTEDGRTINAGESVILNGKEAEHYVRTRDSKNIESNNDRMGRQQEYLKGFLASMIPAIKKDISVVPKLYSTITEHSNSNLNVAKLTYLASIASGLIQSSNDIQFQHIEGKIKEGKFAEFYPKESSLIEVMLNTFYKQIS